MTRAEALTNLKTRSLDYFMHAKFSRVAGLVYNAVVGAAASMDKQYVRGYLDATASTVELIAPKAEAEALSLVLLATKALLDENVPVAHSGASMALFELERLVA